MNVDYENAPFTGGRYYEYLTREQFDEVLPKAEDFTIDDLKVGSKCTFYRIAKNDELKTVHMKISGQLIHVDEEQMIFVHQSSKAKIMKLGGYKEHWFFIVDHPPITEVN